MIRGAPYRCGTLLAATAGVRSDSRWCSAVASAVVGAVALALFTGIAAAQSPFALVNMGQDIWITDARIAGRGGWGMTVADTLALGFKNVAGLVDNPFVGVQMCGFGERSDATEGDSQRRTYRTFVPSFRVSVPIQPGRVALTAGFRARRSTSYSTRRDASWEVDEGTITGFEAFERDGTLWDIPLGAAVRIGRFLALGGTVNLIRGSFVDTRNTVPVWLNRGPDTTGTDVVVPAPYLTSVEENESVYDGTSVTASALMKFFGRLRLGAAYTPEHDVDLSRKVSLGGVGTRYYESFTLRMPAEFQAGAELRLGSRWRLGADYEWQRYSQLTGLPEWEGELEDAWIASFGLERTLGFARRGGFGNVPLRLGATLRRWSYRVGGQPVDEITYSAGTGFALEGGLGQLDIALSYGMIGDLADNGAESDYWRLTVSVTGLERWW
jgi:hypothetical protein